jgi:two-component SAPR family response regulator
MTRHRILVVEDEPILAFDIESTLQVMGCDTVGPVGRLAEAAALIDQEQFDCAILDVNILGGHITSLAETLLDRSVPILLATGYDSFALSERLMKLPRLHKPYTSEELSTEVRRLCEQVTAHGSG